METKTTKIAPPSTTRKRVHTTSAGNNNGRPQRPGPWHLRALSRPHSNPTSVQSSVSAGPSAGKGIGTDLCQASRLACSRVGVWLFPNTHGSPHKRLHLEPINVRLNHVACFRVQIQSLIEIGQRIVQPSQFLLHLTHLHNIRRAPADGSKFSASREMPSRHVQ